MKITIEQIPAEQPEELLIRCHDASQPWVGDLSAMASPKRTVIGWQHDTAFRLALQDVCYFEVVDGRGFLYADKDVYECRMRLYEFEEYARHHGFFRSGKSMVLNAEKISCVIPSLSGRFTATLLNGEKVVVSRQYVAQLKKMLGL